MNMREAREKAKTKWGLFASVRKDRYKRSYPFWVGKIIRGNFQIYGSGNSWEEAFERATKKGY